MLGDDVPEGTQEIGEDQDEKYEAEDTEDVHDIDLIHNLVVIIRHWLHPRILLNTVVYAAAVKLLEKALELLRVQQEKDLVQTEETEQVEEIELVLRP